MPSKNLVPNNNSICVVGDMMLDHYVYGTCDRISPEAPVPVVDIVNEEYTLGGAGNVLKNLIAFECNSSIVTVCGNDEQCNVVNEKLGLLNPSAFNIIKDDSRKTTVKTRVLASKHQLIRLDSENKHPIDASIQNQILDYLIQIIDKLSVLVISDYCKGVLTPALALKIIRLCQENNVVSIVDSKSKDLSMFYGADLIKPNKKEASLATGIKIVDDDSLVLACKKIADITKCKYVVITLSEDGMAILSNNTFTKIPTKALLVFDVTGAGDTVVAALAFALGKKYSIEDACDFANQAAAVVVSKVGSATATLDEIRTAYKH